MMRRNYIVGVALLAASMAVLPLAAQISGGSASITPGQATDNDMLVHDVTEWSDNLFADRNQAIFKDLAKQFTSEAKSDLALVAKLRELAANPKMSRELKNEGIKQALETYKSATTKENAAAFSQKVAKVLERLNFVATAAKAAGYAVEGDYTGAAAAVVQESTKNVLAGGGAVAVSWIPGGQYGGAMFGEYVHETYVKKAIEQYENSVRDKAYAEKYAGRPWLRPQVILDRDGTVRALPPDQYMGKDGVIRIREEDEQKAYEAQMHVNWANNQKWQQVEKDFAAGKVSPSQYSQLRAQWTMRNRNDRWNPLGAGNCDDAAKDPDVKEMLQIAKQLNVIAKSIETDVQGRTDSDAADAAAYRSAGKASGLMAKADRLQVLNKQVVAKYTKECLQGIAVSEGLAPATPTPSPVPTASNGSGTVFNKDGSREVMTTGKAADGKSVRVWTTYNKAGRVISTRVEQ